MTTYDVDSAIGALKRASIDAYMRSQGWDVGTGNTYGKFGNIGAPVTRGSFPHLEFPEMVQCSVSRPNSDGNGGGTLTKHITWSYAYVGDTTNEVAASRFSEDFDGIRGTIDDALRPFRGLPDPAALDETIALCMAADQDMSLDPESGAGGSVLDAHINSAKSHMLNISGAFPTAFEAMFLNQLKGTIKAIRALATARWAALVQEQALWVDTRSAVEQLVADATTSMNACAEHKHADFSIVLKILEWVGKGLDIAVAGTAAGPAGVLVAAGNLGLSILDDIDEGELTASSDASGAGFDEILGAFVGTANDLRMNVDFAESSIKNNVDNNINSHFDNKRSYQIHKDPNIEVAPSADIVRDVDDCHAVAVTFLPAAAAIMRELAGTCSAVQPAPFLRRAGSIGCGPTGPAPEFARMSEILYDLLENLSAETLSACDAFVAWLDDMDRHEEAVIEQIAGFRDQLDTPTRWDPVDTRTPSGWMTPRTSHLMEPDWHG